MNKIRAAVIGLGIGRVHAEAYHALDEAELVAVCDLDDSRLRPVAERYECRAYNKVDDLLADAEVDLVSVATPHPSHADLAIRAMRAGKHVIVEKPMAVSVAQADEMIAVSQETGRMLAPVFQFRFLPPVLNMKRAIDDGKIGTPILGSCHVQTYRDKAYYDQDKWRGHWDTEGGGVLINQAIHGLDMLVWLMGEPVEVIGRWANLTHPYIEVEDNAAVIIRFRGDALGVLTATTSITWGQMRLAVHGSKGHSVGGDIWPSGFGGYNDIWTIPGEEDQGRTSMVAHVAGGRYYFRPQGEAKPFLTPPDWSPTARLAFQVKPDYHLIQLKDILRSLLGGQQPMVHVASARASLAVLFASYESRRTGQPVQLS
jgi:UDP-N-acetyl-2-amino-2-deoxyglucuronate dehydrogenase